MPLAVDPTRLAWRTLDDTANETNTVVFKLSVACSRGPDGEMVNDKGVRRAVIGLSVE